MIHPHELSRTPKDVLGKELDFVAKLPEMISYAISSFWSIKSVFNKIVENKWHTYLIFFFCGWIAYHVVPQLFALRSTTKSTAYIDNLSTNHFTTSESKENDIDIQKLMTLGTAMIMGLMLITVVILAYSTNHRKSVSDHHNNPYNKKPNKKWHHKKKHKVLINN